MKSTTRNKRGSFARISGLANSVGRLSQNQAETAVAAARTISYRTDRMIRAFGNPVAMSDPEFLRMGTEKLEAAYEAGHAVAGRFSGLSASWTRLLNQQVQFSRLMTAELNRNPQAFAQIWALPFWFSPQSKPLRSNLEAQMGQTITLGAQMAAMMGAGLAPYLQRTRSNAKRLSRHSG